MRAPALALLLALVIAPAAHGASGRVIFTDPLSGVPGQHATAVEPDSAAWGETVVSVFQVGRIRDGGAAAIGWATSHDGGSTWRTGLLPGITGATSPPGPHERASDPVVAYDRVRGVWVASVLTVDPLPGGRDSSLVVSRSQDGLTWSPPVTTSPERGVFAHDKNWIACDTWAASPFAGRCYVTWTDTLLNAVALSVSTDGGLTWSAPRLAGSDEPSGTQPVARPDGTLVIPYLSYAAGPTLRAIVSRDGGATLGMPVVVADVRPAPVPGLRSPPLASVEVDADGRVYAAWHDCRFRARCATNDIVLVSSADGLAWSNPARVPLSPLRFTRGGATHHVIPGLAVDPASRGGAGRLALASYAVGSACSDLACPIAARYVSSADGGRTWSAPVALSDPLPLGAIADTTQGRMVGDYVSTSFVGGGVAVPVVSAPVATPAGRLDQPILAAAFAPRRAAPVRPVRLVVSPARRGRPLAATLQLDRLPVRPRPTCLARAGRVTLRTVGQAFSGERVSCRWTVPRTLAALRVRVSVGVRHASGRVGRSATVRLGTR